MKISLSFFFGILLAVFTSTIIAGNAELPAFISIADIHFDPFFGCTLPNKSCIILKKLQNSNYKEWGAIFDSGNEQAFSTVSQDTNYPLFRSTLHELADIAKRTHPKFILILGDFLAHDFPEKYKQFSENDSTSTYEEFVKKTLQFMTYQIRLAMPEIDIYPVVGNNDTYSGDYQVIVNGEFLKNTALIWKKFLINKKNQQNFEKQFTYAGYYTVTIPSNEKLKIIILNTVLFSVENKSKRVKMAAFEQLKWLEQQLNLAKNNNQHILLVFHIPDGINIYATLKNKLTIQNFWHTDDSDEFKKILKKYAKSISTILPAHIHVDSINVLAMHYLEQIPVIFTPSISPIFGNNPAFKLFMYHPDTFQIDQENTYFYPIDFGKKGTWKMEYSLNSDEEVVTIN